MLDIQDMFDSDDESSEAGGEKEDIQSGHRKFALTSLTPGKIESSMHDIVITSPARVKAEVIGRNTIHLSGYYCRTYNGESEEDDSEYMMDEDEEGIDYDDDDDEGYPLQDISSDVEIEVDDLMSGDELPDDSHRFEEVIEEEEEAVPATKKRPREEEDVPDKPAPEANLSKKQKKKLKAQQAAAAASGNTNVQAKSAIEGPPQKKVKAENGTAVPVEKKEEKEKKPKEKQKEKPKEDKKDKPTQAKTVEHPNGLKTTDTKIGDGELAKKGSRVSVRYIGKLTNGKTFDSNTKGSPFQFKLGAGDVIQGWDQGLVGMKVGGERRIIVPPKLGYGQKKMGSIPPNSVLEFEVKLLSVK